MKITLIILLCLFNLNILAKDKFLCSALTLHKYKSIVPSTEYDKVKHCSYSCILGKKCGALESWTVGVAKEISDLLGFGTPDLEDLRANRKGIKLGKKVKSINECLPKCQTIYDDGRI